MPSEWMIEVVKQAPALGVLAWIVIHVFRALERMNEAHATRSEAQNTRHELQIGGITKRHEGQVQSIIAEYQSALDRNSRLYERVLERLGEIHGDPKGS